MALTLKAPPRGPLLAQERGCHEGMFGFSEDMGKGWDVSVCACAREHTLVFSKYVVLCVMFETCVCDWGDSMCSAGVKGMNSAGVGLS